LVDIFPHRSWLALGLSLPLLAASGLAGAEEAAGDETGWQNEGELGLSTASGNSETTTATASVSGDREGRKWSAHLLGEGRYSEEEGESTSQRIHGRAQVDYSFSRRYYSFGLLEATNDRFAGYELRLQESVGMGRKLFLDRDSLDWRLEGGPALRQEWTVDDTYDRVVSARIRTLFEWRFNERSALTEELVWTQSVEDVDEYLATNVTSLRLRINSRLALKTSVRVEHDSRPPKGAEPTDVWTTTSLLYSF